MVTPATNDSRACPASASRYAAHAVAPSERTRLGSGEAWSTRPATASTALTSSAIATIRTNTCAVDIMVVSVGSGSQLQGLVANGATTSLRAQHAPALRRDLARIRTEMGDGETWATATAPDRRRF